jgi:hypothetical protein
MCLALSWGEGTQMYQSLSLHWRGGGGGWSSQALGKTCSGQCWDEGSPVTTQKRIPTQPRDFLEEATPELCLEG